MPLRGMGRTFFDSGGSAALHSRLRTSCRSAARVAPVPDAITGMHPPLLPASITVMLRGVLGRLITPSRLEDGRIKTTSIILAILAAILLPCVVARGQTRDATSEARLLRESIEKTNDPNRDVRVNAAIALRNMGPRAKTALSALTRLLNDKETRVRYRAAQALGAIGPEAKSAVPTLTKSLDDDYWVVRTESALALGKIGPGGKGCCSSSRQDAAKCRLQ